MVLLRTGFLPAFDGWGGLRVLLQILERGLNARAEPLRIRQGLIEVAQQVLDDFVGISVVGWQAAISTSAAARRQPTLRTQAPTRLVLLAATAAGCAVRVHPLTRGYTHTTAVDQIEQLVDVRSVDRHHEHRAHVSDFFGDPL